MNTCLHKNVLLNKLLFLNSTNHLEKWCGDCKKFLGYAEINTPLQDDNILMFGKYKNHTLGEISKFDIPYLIWCYKYVEGFPQSLLEYINVKKKENNKL
jgi:hypothetical protein